MIISNAKYRLRSASDGGGGQSRSLDEPTGDLKARKMNYEIRRIPFERRSCQVCKDNDKGNFMTLHLKDEIEHAAECHGDVEVCYVCQKCGKIYTSKHPTVCQSALSRLQ